MENGSLKKKISPLYFVLLIILVGFGVISYLALWKSDYNAINTNNKSTTIIERIRTLQTSGGSLEISEEEINSTFKTLLNKPIEKYGVIIKGLYLKFDDDNVSLYAPVLYKNVKLLPNIKGQIKYENDRVIFSIASIKIGKLSIPKGIVMSRLKRYSSDDIIIENNEVKISKYLLPFNAKDIYIKENKIVAEIEKISLPVQNPADSKQSGSNQQGANDQGSSKTGQNNGSEKVSSTSETNSQNAGNNSNAATASKAENSSSSGTTAPKDVKVAQVNTLNKVSGQLSGVIANVQTSKEKEMMKKIQTVVSEVAKNPNYPYQSEANEVKAWYAGLPLEEKVRVRSAIMSNVNVIEILKLINIFGV